MSGVRLAFELPPCLEASEPPEARGVARDGVRLMVAHRDGSDLVHSTFDQLPDFLAPGDLVVVNTSATIPAALDAVDRDGTRVVVHLSTRLDGDLWVVERRRRTSTGTSRWAGVSEPGVLTVGTDASVELLEPYGGSARLWVARLALPKATLTWLGRHGRPIRYDYVPRPWPLSSYQTVYATEPGSAEMPSAGRPFTAEVIAALVARGIAVTPIVLHSGVASLEADETPYPERVQVPEWTAARVNATRAAAGRIVAVGTTVVRALESAASPGGTLAGLDGWTDLVIGPDRPATVVDGIITGWHEPETSHLQLLESIAGRDALERSYSASLTEHYLFHEFGDSHLILP